MFYKIFIFIFINYVFSEDFFQNDSPLVKTTSGVVRGQAINILNKTIQQFLGIPFAEPPVGGLRFAKPKPISKAIEGIIDATKPKHSSIQQYDEWVGNVTTSEDCLTLNIWSPKQENNNSTKLKAVMFWIFGGGLNIGSIFQNNFGIGYNGTVLATHDVVLVSVNYRLGHLGFLYGGEESAPGNLGLYDQLLGLKWVRENIHLFGGDKNQITIFGESAGSWSVSSHVLSPLSNGLFKRAILESGAHLYNKDRRIATKEEALLSAKQLAKRLNCTNDKEWLKCLKTVDANRLFPEPLSYSYPLEDTEFLPFSAQKAFNQIKFNRGLDLIAGITRDEGPDMVMSLIPELLNKTLTEEDFRNAIKKADSIFHNLNAENIKDFYLNNVNKSDSNAIKWKIFDIYGDLMMKCPTYLFAKRYAEQSTTQSNVFFYELTHTALDLEYEKQFGVNHGSDLVFVFGDFILKPNETSEDNLKLTKEVLKLWTDFAKYGKPDSNWLQLIDTKSHSSVTQIKDLNPKNGNKYFKNLFEQTCDGFWKNYFQ